MTAKLTATMNGLFAGYVHEDGSIGEGYEIAKSTTRILTAATTSLEIQVQTYFGKNMIAGTYTAGTGLATKLTDVPENGTAANTAIAPSTNLLVSAYTSIDAPVGYAVPRFYTAQKDQVTHDQDFAREGTYKVEFTYWKATSTKATTESAAFTVKNDLYIPGVSVKSQTLDSYDQEGWAEAVVSEVDLNNDDSSTWSVINLVDKNGATIEDNKTPAKWVVVTEEGVDFYKPLDRTFKLS